MLSQHLYTTSQAYKLTKRSKGLRGRIRLLRIKSIGRITLKDPERGRLRGISPWHRVNAAFRDLKEVE